MTEKKQRFTIEVDDENFVQILDNNVQIGQYNVCKLLNELVDENEQLKKENKTLANGLTAYFESKIKKE